MGQRNCSAVRRDHTSSSALSAGSLRRVRTCTALLKGLIGRNLWRVGTSPSWLNPAPRCRLMKMADICLGSRTSGAASRNWAKRRSKSLREQVAPPAKRPGAGELEVGLLTLADALFDGQRSFVCFRLFLGVERRRVDVLLV